MAHSSSSTARVQQLDVPLVDCPRCSGARLLLLTSKTKTTAGQVFVKCLNNQAWVKPPKKCSFFKWLEEYRAYLVQIGISIKHEGISESNDKWKVEDEFKKTKVEDGYNSLIRDWIDVLKLEMRELNVATRKLSQ